MDELQARKESLLAQLAGADAPVPLLHPNLAVLYREKVAALAAALHDAGSRSAAAEALRRLENLVETGFAIYARQSSDNQRDASIAASPGGTREF